MQCNVMGCTVFDATQNNGVVTEYESPGPATPGAERQARCGFACRVRWDIDKLMIHDDMIVDISHRIHGAAIYGDIYHQYTPVMLVYIPYMDPMGIDKDQLLLIYDWQIGIAIVDKLWGMIAIVVNIYDLIIDKYDNYDTVSLLTSHC